MTNTETDSTIEGKARPEQKVEKQRVFLYLFTHNRPYPARAHEYTPGSFFLVHDTCLLRFLCFLFFIVIIFSLFVFLRTMC